VFSLEEIVTIIDVNVLGPASQLLMASSEGFVGNNDTGVRHIGVHLLFSPAELDDEVF
jgi:hypothetical protein